jgi:hypothetical protein
LGLFSLFLEEAGIDAVFEVSAGGGGGDGFEEGEVVFAGECSPGKFLGGAVESFFGGEGFGAKVLEEVFEGVVDHFQGKFDEVGGVAGAVGFFQGVVVVLLMILDEGLDGDEFEGGMVVVEEDALPKATDAAIAILEGVDEFEFVVEDTGADEGVEVVVREEGEEVVHEIGNAVGLGGDVGDC